MKNFINKARYAGAALVAVAAGAANAAIPTEVTTMFTDLGVDVGTAIGLGYGLLVLAFGGVWLMGFIKKVGSKAK